MTTTATYVEDENQTFRPFYYLKVHGLPYYFFATIDPTSTVYGSSAWTLPSGYTSVRGMMIPEAQMDQSLPDMLGGIASPERLRVELMDMDVTDAHGTHSMFGRLLAPGRIITSTSAAVGQLSVDINATADSGDTFTVLGTAAQTFVAGDVYVGMETIAISAASYSAPNWTLTISARNKFPCNAGYPAVPYHTLPRP